MNITFLYNYTGIGSWILISFTLPYFVTNSLASQNPSFEVTEQNDSGTFSSLSRDFDQTIDNINDDDKNSTDTTNDDESLQERS